MILPEKFPKTGKSNAIEIFPLIQKNNYDSPPPVKNIILLKCPVESCNCSFFIQKKNKENSLIVCPKGHNICGEVFLFIFYSKKKKQ